MKLHLRFWHGTRDSMELIYRKAGLPEETVDYIKFALPTARSAELGKLEALKLWHHFDSFLKSTRKSKRTLCSTEYT